MTVCDAMYFRPACRINGEEWLFAGLSLTEAKKLSSYFHFTEPVNLKNKTLLEKADLDPSTDFLDSLEHDVPQGKDSKIRRYNERWSAQSEKYCRDEVWVTVQLVCLEEAPVICKGTLCFLNIVLSSFFKQLETLEIVSVPGLSHPH